jgi:NAD(P) transhydrogenase subunit beta
LVLYNGIGGAAAGATAATVLFGNKVAGALPLFAALIGGLAGVVSLSGSLTAWSKLNGVIDLPLRIRGQQVSSLIFMITALAAGGYIVCTAQDGADRLIAAPGLTYLVLGLVALIFGALVTSPVNKVQMPFMISIYTVLAALAIGVEGFASGSPTLMIAGGMVGAARMVMTLLMATHGGRQNVSALGRTGSPRNDSRHAGSSIL